MISIREATPADAVLIHTLITELALYEREPHAVKVTAETIEQQLRTDKRPFECVIAENNGVAAGFAVYFYAYSTWEGRETLYLEDLYVRQQFRSAGVGFALMTHLAQVASDRNCPRFEWSVLTWNEPAIDFYNRIGAAPVDGWMRYRMTPETISALADS